MLVVLFSLPRKGHTHNLKTRVGDGEILSAIKCKLNSVLLMNRREMAKIRFMTCNDFTPIPSAQYLIELEFV
jgi:hypothetical protein